jgi:hypothetical protein
MLSKGNVRILGYTARFEPWPLLLHTFSEFLLRRLVWLLGWGSAYSKVFTNNKTSMEKNKK